MYTLFLDTHSEDVIIVLFKDDKIVEKVSKKSHFQHSQITLPTIKELLTNNGLIPKDLGQIIVVNGPGSFTGVRIAVVIGKTMAYSLSIPIKVIDSLLIKAVSVDFKDNIIVSEKEKNGAFIGQFNSELQAVKDYEYLSSNEYIEFSKDNTINEDVEIDYERVYNYLNNVEAINPHAVKPLYIKHIGVLK